MLKKFLKDVVILTVGKNAEDIVDLLNSKRHVNEFSIAKKLDITINQARNILYKLSDYGLVSFIRKKDKRKGWYTYFWKFEIFKCLEFLKSFLIKKIEQLRNQINSREKKQFYFCKRCDIEFNDENALLRDFTCNECGDILSLKNNSKVLKDLNRNLEKFEKELELVDIEIKKENEILEKRRLFLLKKEKKEKKLKRMDSKKKRILNNAKKDKGKTKTVATKSKKKVKKGNGKLSKKLKKPVKTKKVKKFPKAKKILKRKPVKKVASSKKKKLKPKKKKVAKIKK